MANVAFIGLGIMGLPMAGHLLSSGHTLTVYSRTKSKAAELLARGAAWADSPAAAAATAAQVIFLCLPDTPDVEQVISGPEGLLSVIRPGQIVVDHSTISPTRTRFFAAELEGRQAFFIDAPVSGGDSGAKNGTLSIMVGCNGPAEFQRVLPLLQCMGKTITHCGPSGAGQSTKLVNQILVSVTNLAVCEALLFARRNGLDDSKTLAAVSGGAAGSWQLTNLGPRMLAGDFDPGFMISLQYKDLRLAIEAAKASGLELHALSMVTDAFARASENGRGKQGTQALFAQLESESAPPRD